MTFDLQKLLESKRALRHDLATRPIVEKLRILDALRERELAIRGRKETSVFHEEPPSYRTGRA